MSWIRWLLVLTIGAHFTQSAKSDVQQSNEIISQVTSSYEFGKSITVTAGIDPSRSFQNLSLFLQPDSQAQLEFPLTVAPDGAIRYSIDLLSNPITPYARVYYWFALTQEDGTIINSPSYWFDYIDNRLNWRSTTSDLFIIRWSGDDLTLGQKAQTIARDGLKEATQWLPVVPQLPIQIYIYPDLDSLKSAMAITSQPWAAGQTHPELGVILISQPDAADGSMSLERQIPHELMHILQYMVTGSRYSEIPSFLMEGLATQSELYPDPDRDRELKAAYDTNQLLPFSELCLPFSNSAEKAYLSYAESASLVKFLSDKYGASSLTRLLNRYANGMDCASAVQAEYKISMNQIEQEWQLAEFSKKRVRMNCSTIGPFFLSAGSSWFHWQSWECAQY